MHSLHFLVAHKITLSVRCRETDLWGGWSGITADTANLFTSGDKTVHGELQVDTDTDRRS